MGDEVKLPGSVALARAGSCDAVDREASDIAPRATLRGAIRLWAFSVAAITAAILIGAAGQAVTVVELMMGIAINAGLLGVATAAGAVTASRVGLVSLLATSIDDVHRRMRQLPAFAAVGVVAGIFIAVVDQYLFTSVSALSQLLQSNRELLDQQPPVHLALPVRMLYGGVVEEVLTRWGVLSVLAWLFGRLGRRKNGSAVIAAIVVSAALFGALHLPATYQVFVDPPAAMLFRVVLMNTLVGVLFGFAYWRSSLEAAMACHAAAHIGLLASVTTAF